jgi:hypothetical protein
MASVSDLYDIDDNVNNGAVRSSTRSQVSECAASSKSKSVVIAVLAVLLALVLLGLAMAFSASSIAVQSVTSWIEGLRTKIGQIWRDLATQVQALISAILAGSISQIAQLTASIQQRLSDLVDLLKPWLPNGVELPLRMRLSDHVTGVVSLVQAVQSKSEAAVAHTRDALRANATQLAQLLGNAAPAVWSRDAIQGALFTHIDSLLMDARCKIGTTSTGSTSTGSTSTGSTSTGPSPTCVVPDSYVQVKAQAVADAIANGLAHLPFTPPALVTKKS